MSSTTICSILEVCVENAEKAVEAVGSGAGRIELCSRLDLDGLSPPFDEITSCLQLLDNIDYIDNVKQSRPVPLHVMVRLRAGDFVYSDDEIISMEQYIDQVKQLKIERENGQSVSVSGFVIGCLEGDAISGFKIDQNGLKRLIRACKPYQITFHRAFDLISDKQYALKVLHDHQVDRVLTSGAPGKATDHIPTLTNLIQQANQLNTESSHTIRILPGGGIRSWNAKQLLDLGFDEIHSSTAFQLDNLP